MSACLVLCPMVRLISRTYTKLFTYVIAMVSWLSTMSAAVLLLGFSPFHATQGEENGISIAEHVLSL